MDDKTKLSYWLGQTGGRTNAAYTLQKEYNQALQGRGPGPRTLKKDMVSTTSSTPSISTPTGYQYDPRTYNAPNASTTSDPNQAFGMRSPAGARGMVDFQAAGNKVPLETKHAVGMGAIIAAPFALAAAVPAIATGVAGASAIGAYGGLGAGLAGGAATVAKVASKVGSKVSSVLPATKASKLAADTAAKKTADRLANAEARKKAAAAAAKKKKAAADKAQKGETAAAQNYAGAIGQQDARMGGSGARR